MRKRKRIPRIAFELENKGSVARDHLASERTFLAWLRTSLALASIGIGKSLLSCSGRSLIIEKVLRVFPFLLP